MRPSEALTQHRDELRRLVSRYDVERPRVYGSVLTGKDDDESEHKRVTLGEGQLHLHMRS